jgi:hypothetical protein
MLYFIPTYRKICPVKIADVKRLECFKSEIFEISEEVRFQVVNGRYQMHIDNN